MFGFMGDGDDVVVDVIVGECVLWCGLWCGGGCIIVDWLSEQGNKLLQDVVQKVGEFGCSEVDIEYLFLVLILFDVVKMILEQFKVDVDDLCCQIEKEVKCGDVKMEGEIGVSFCLKDVLNWVFIVLNEFGYFYVGFEYFLIGFVEEGEGLVVVMLCKLGLMLQVLCQQVMKVVGKGVEEGCVEILLNIFDFDQFSCDLMKFVCDGKFDFVIGCVCEIEMMIEVLVCWKKNNLVLIGEFGVGKIVIVEGFV